VVAGCLCVCCLRRASGRGWVWRDGQGGEVSAVEAGYDRAVPSIDDGVLPAVELAVRVEETNDVATWRTDPLTACDRSTNGWPAPLLCQFGRKYAQKKVGNK
jgi:hypothetical protein